MHHMVLVPTSRVNLRRKDALWAAWVGSVTRLWLQLGMREATAQRPGSLDMGP